ncbi:enoyl-CoA hydratase-like protein [Lineolata rhizophorae]|uniref:Enoyl-CoA hydratase-like protein n=1 Tax=Lineolata rhizophorae TaxID=578093 RepID=A0A6A6P8P1_9PEZI|nr:enoyl-CoA hydratase-like protein [Lineolata rhizophorae]
MSSPPPPTTTPPPPVSPTTCLLSYPAPHVLLVTINRPRAHNALTFAAHWELDAVFDWLDREPTLRVAVVTGAGDKAFCAGQDLIEVERLRAGPARPPAEAGSVRLPPGGFAGLSRRKGKKPVIAAVNGLALGGGFEIVLNCDMIVASPTATFGLPEALRGIYAAAGGPARLVRTVGLPLASEIALAGRVLSAAEALSARLVNRVADRPGTEAVVREALRLADGIAAISPDAAVVTRAALREAWERGNVEAATESVLERYHAALMEAENTREGLAAFKEKRKPVWKPSKL